MARTATKPRSKTISKPSSSSSPKKRLGGPPGSKNKVAAGTTRQLLAASVSRRPVAKQTVQVAPKTSKADLEAQNVKLEQALARSRNQITKLKLMVSDLGERVERAEQAELDRLDERAQAPATKTSKGKLVKQKPLATRGRRKTAEPVLDEATGEAETEAHAS